MHCIDRYISLDGNCVCCWHLEVALQRLGTLRYFICCLLSNSQNVVALGRYYSTLDKEEATRRPKQPVEHQIFVWEECKQLT